MYHSMEWYTHLGSGLEDGNMMSSQTQGQGRSHAANA